MEYSYSNLTQSDPMSAKVKKRLFHFQGFTKAII